MQEEIELLENIISEQKNILYGIDRKYNEECRKRYNEEERKLYLLNNILKELINIDNEIY
jgi:hypothetical protein